MNPIISAVLKLLNLGLPPQESVIPQYRRAFGTDSPKDFDNLSWVNPDSPTGSYVTECGQLIFVIYLP